MSRRARRGGSRTSSFLVRLWEEPRHMEGRTRPVRCFVRNLRTGEERYLEDPRDLGDLLTATPSAGADVESAAEGSGQRGTP